MGLRISTNVASLMVQHQMSKTQRELEVSLSQLASGSKFTSSTTDNASRSIAEGLKAQQKGLAVANRNADDAISFIQTAEGALNEQSNILLRQRELAVQAASDTFSDTERGYLNQEFTQLGQELDRIAKSTTYGSTSLLKGQNKTFEFQVGVSSGKDSRIIYENNADTTASNLSVAGLDISDKSDARDSLESIDEAIKTVSSVRAGFGAIQSRLQAASNFLSVHGESIASAYSQLADTDVAAAVTEARKGQILQQYQAAALVQTNQMPEQALRLVA